MQDNVSHGGKKKRAVETKVKPAQNFLFKKCLPAAPVGKICDSPPAYPIQLLNPQFRRDCEGAVCSALLEPRAHSAAAEQDSSIRIPSSPPSPYVAYVGPAKVLSTAALQGTGSLGSPRRTPPHLESFHAFSHILRIHSLFTHLFLHDKNIPSVSRV